MSNLTQAFEAWRQINGLEVLDQSEANNRYSQNTLSLNRIIPGALRPTTVEQIQQIVKVANQFLIKIFTFSSGHNWGFGSSIPTIDNCVIVDLSGMKRVLECNDKLGFITIEPGVTQQDLHNYFVKKNLSFMVPTTGAGPSCSIIGNALERGYGLTPHIDHFGAVLALQAVLANGDIYRSSFAEFGAHQSDNIYKWKVGPYLDGLFSQSNLGIVTQATIALARRPENIGQYIAYFDQEDFTKIVPKVAGIMERFGTMIGGVNLMNTHRLLSMVEEQKAWGVQGLLPQEHISRLARKRRLPEWALLVGIYSPNELIGGIKRYLKAEIGPYANEHLYLNRRRLSFLKKLLKFLPRSGIARTIRTIDLAFQTLEGVPTEVALPLAYLKNPQLMPEKNRHPDHDGCGLLWYCPLVPVDPQITDKFVKGVKKIMVSEQIEPMITLTTISQRCFASNIPLVFNRNDKEQTERAYRCFDRLLEFALQLGLFPDRLDLRTLRNLYDVAETPKFEMHLKIKDALDPNHIFSPGRYIKLTEKDKS